MPPSLRARTLRSSRPYRRLSTTSAVQTTKPLATPDQPANTDPVSRDPTTTTPDAFSEPTTPPDRPGLPTYAEYKRIEAGYLSSLSPRKRDKALITQAMFDKIWDVLHQPDACTIETPQFRFWVRKMFRLSRPVWVTVTDRGNRDGVDVGDGDGDGGGRKRIVWTSPDGPMIARNTAGDDSDSDSDADAEAEAEAQDLALERAMGIGAIAYPVSAVVLHENRPVAIMEQLYELFCFCHVRAGHGGRDKTCTVIRQHYSWVPKELTAQFVKACPTCAVKRSGMGMGMGMMSIAAPEMAAAVQAQKQRQRQAGKREKKARTSEEAFPDLVTWPASGGPLDPQGPTANPEPGPPCTLLWHGHEREQPWFGVREDVLRSSPAVSPASSLPTASPCEQPAGFPPPSSHTPTRTGPPLVPTDLVHLHLGLSPAARALGDAAGPEGLIRLSGPCAPGGRPSGSPSSGSSSSSSAASSWTSDRSPSHAFCLPIDPVLLSFDYPGLVRDFGEWEDTTTFAPWRTEDAVALVAATAPRTGTPSPPAAAERRLDGLGLRTGDDDGGGGLGVLKGQTWGGAVHKAPVSKRVVPRSTPRLSPLSLSSSSSSTRSSPYGDRHRRVNSPLTRVRYHTLIQHPGCATDVGGLGLGLGLADVEQESDGTRSPLIVTASDT